MNANPPDAPPLQEFFILGNPRSGTSLLRNILNAHPSVCVPPECGFLLWLAPRFTKATWDDATKATFIDEVMRSKKFETWELPRTDLEAVIMPARIGSYAEAASRVYVAYARSRKRTISTWGDKNNYYIQHIPAIRALFPDARYIHIVRDVRDVACSYLELGRSTSGSDYYPDLSTDVEQAATEWEANNALIEHEARGNASNYLLLRYEDLVHSFRSTIGTVFNFLGVGTPEGFNERAHLAGLDEPTAFLEWKRKVAGPVETSSMGRYKNELDATTITLIERIAQAGMERYGYVNFGGHG